jgi:hypothetical protein
MLAADVVPVSIVTSLIVVAVILAVAIIASLVRNRREQTRKV